MTRWEWRTFGDHFGHVNDQLEALPSRGEEQSDELYFLSPTGENVKVRGGLLDIKVLREVDGVGLQRWEPVVKAPFPLTGADVAAAFEGLRQPVPKLGREVYTLEQFVAELVEPTPAIRAVRVHKRRRRYTIHGCPGELSEVEAAGKTTRTLAVETEDPAALWAAVKALGVRGRVNTSFPEGLRRLVDDELPRYAVIDCGTNSIKFHVGARGHDGTWTKIVDRAEITRLGEGVGDTGDDLDRGHRAHGRHRQGDGQRGSGPPRSSRGRRRHGRAAPRRQPGRGRAGHRGGKRDRDSRSSRPRRRARLAYLAARAGLGFFDGSIAVVDTGGGSTQFTFGDTAGMGQRFSVDVGAVRYTERFGLANAVAPEVLQQALDAIAADLNRLDSQPAPDALVGMGGAITNITAVNLGLAQYDPDRVQGAVLDRAEIDRQIELYRTRDTHARARDRRPAAQTRRCHPRRRMHRPHRHGQARAGLADGQRPRPAPRRAGRAIRHHA